MLPGAVRVLPLADRQESSPPAPEQPQAPSQPTPQHLDSDRLDALLREFRTLRQRVDALAKPRGMPAPPAGPPVPVVATGPGRRPTLRLVSAERDSVYRQWTQRLARTSNRGLRELLLSPELIFYDDSSTPPAFQVTDEGRAEVRLVSAAITATANAEFPWARPAGTTAEGPVKSVRFVKFGGPVEWWRQRHQDGTFAGFAWSFAAGTTFGEILFITDARGQDHAWEIRIRRKAQDGHWSVNAFRPFPTEDDLWDAAKARGVRLVLNDATRRTVDSGHQRDGFRDSAFETVLPAMSEATVADLLDRTPFRSAAGRSWRVQPEHGVDIPSPTSAQAFSIVPRGFLGAFLPVNDTSCARCHVDAGRVVNATGEARWRVRGGDRVMSFHPFEASSITTPPLRLNGKLVEAGLLRHRAGEP